MSRTIYEEICKDTLRKNLTAGLNRRDDMALRTIPTIAGGPAPVTITTTPTTISKATATTPSTTAISSSVTAQASALKSSIVVNKTNSSSVVSLFDYYLFEERKRRVEECHDGADRHKGCYFIFRGDDKVEYAMPYNALSLSHQAYTLRRIILPYYHSVPQQINQSLTYIHNINRPSHTHIPSPDHESSLF